MAWSVPPDQTIRLHVRLGLLLVALTGAIYLVQLDRFPIVIGGDEVQFAVHAEALAQSGRDLNGTRWPAFFRITDPLVPNDSSQIWYQPLLFYVMTPFIAAFGVNEWSARLPVALIAIANVWLIYGVGRRLFADPRHAIAAALLMALTPAHVIVSRQALDYIAPLPFVLTWLLFLLRYLDTGSLRSLAIGMAALGGGLFSYVAAWLLMPVFFAMTAIAIRQSPVTRKGRALMVAALVFSVPAALLAVAFWWTPDALAQILARYEVGAAARPRPGLWERITLYWDYFNPSFLFFAGGSNPTQATGRAGVFPLALLPLLIAGLREVLSNGSPRSRLITVGLLVSPLPIAITMPPAAAYSVARAMTLLPFAVLLAAYGLQSLSRFRWSRVVMPLLAAAVLIQFAMFWSDYRGDYQLRAGARLDPANMRAVAEAIAESERREPAKAIFFSHALDDGGVRWRFYSLKHGRGDLWEKSRHVNLTENRQAVSPGALVVCYARDAVKEELLKAGYREVAAVAGVAGEPATVILRAPG